MTETASRGSGQGGPVTGVSPGVADHAAVRPGAGPLAPPDRVWLGCRVFWGLLLRDARVLRRDLVSFLLRTVVSPLLFVFVFTYVFPQIGGGVSGLGADFATVLVPGLLAVAIFFQGISGVALPLSIELGGTREIEDRLMAPVPVRLVALEKVVFSAVQSLFAAAVVFPFVYLVPVTPVEVQVVSWPLLLGVIVLAGLTSGALGLVLGTVINPRKIGLLFATVVLPVTFLGCVYYPWSSLSAIPWLQVAVLANPLVYVSELLRAALTPGVPHLPPVVGLAATTAALVLLLAAGMRLFHRRVTA